MRHKHADAIHAWAEGEEIEYLSDSGEWQLVTWTPYFVEPNKWRIKPKKVKKEGWLSIYGAYDVYWYATKELADKNERYDRKACIRIEWEEEE